MQHFQVKKLIIMIDGYGVEIVSYVENVVIAKTNVNQPNNENMMRKDKNNENIKYIFLN